VHGQSWGGNVAAKVVETYGAAKHGPYDGALLTSDVLGGGSRGYDYRVDLRVVYQYYCRNHPRPSEPQYPLREGLRADSTMTATGLRARLQECTGYASEPEERTAAQQRNLDDILAVTKIPERTLESHLRFATFTFRDIVHSRLGVRNRSAIRAYGIPVPTTTGRSTPASSGSRPTRAPYATSPTTATSPAG
jgi:hypothetical protein